MMAAGKTETKCASMSNDTMMAACLPSQFTLVCPANNQKADMQPEFAMQSAVTCNLCSFDVGDDKDVVKDKYWISIKFSPLNTNDAVAQASSGKIVGGVTHYELHWVDGDGRSLEKVLTINAGIYDTTCCAKDMYKFSIKGSYPTGYSKLAIRAKSKAGFLPFTDFSKDIADKETGKVKKVTGSFTAKMSKSTINTIKDDPKLTFTLQKSIAESIKSSNPANAVTADDVYIKSISVKGAGYGDGNTWVAITLDKKARRLADLDFKVDYEVIQLASVSAATTIQPADLKKKIVDNAKSEMNVDVVIVGAPTVSAQSSKEEEGSKKPPAKTTSGSVSKYAVSAMVAVIAFGVQVLL